MNGTVVIIGGGMGGLFTGALLARNGYRVTVLEQNAAVGGGLLGCRSVAAAEELVEEGEGGGAPVVLLPVRIAGLGHQALHPLGPAEGGHHLVGEVVQVLVGDAHLLHHIINGLDAKLPGALQAKPFVLGLAVLNFRHKDDCHILMAAGT